MIDPLAALSVEEKAGLTSGASFFATKGVADLPAVTLADGPHGVRAQRSGSDALGISASEPATCFPPAVSLSQSWDVDLVARVAAATGEEALHYGVGVLLGPAVNIKRDPRAGRNFEYYSEDPVLASELGAAAVRGLQSQGVGASVKHFAANNVERDRMRSDSDVDERALREIYLRVFERVVKKAAPWTVMSSYNRINGVFASESRWLLTEVLRDEWGFDGMVVSDWTGVRDRIASITAGVDLAMPSRAEGDDAALAVAVQDGRLEPDLLDTAARNVVTLLERVAAGARSTPLDVDAHHALAREAAARSVVLLKNDQDLLPLALDTSIAVVGLQAAEPRFQGGGSSHVHATRVDVPIDEIRDLFGDITYASGLAAPGCDAATAQQEAVSAAARADVAIVFMGTPDQADSEGNDRDTIELPAEQLDLLRAICAAQARTVVVLSHGGVVRLTEVVPHAAAILDAGLLGQGGGHAIAQILAGEMNPSGRLSETIPVRLQDVPAYLDFPGENSHIRYSEGIYVGHRWYDKRGLDVAFPFGHGLSYTTFEYSDLGVSTGPEGIEVRVRVANTGTRDGREVVQVYTGVPNSRVFRAVHELKAFASVPVAAGTATYVTLFIPREDLAYWETRTGQWIVEGAAYDVHVAASSRDMRLSASVEVDGDDVGVPLSMQSTLGELMTHPVAGPILREMSPSTPDEGEATSALGMDVMHLMRWTPLERAATMGGQEMDLGELQQLIDHANSR